MAIQIRAYRHTDAEAVTALVQNAYAEFKPLVPDWPTLKSKLSGLADSAAQSTVMLAEQDGRLIGAVGYVAPGQPKPKFFKPEWAMVRMLAVAPHARGMGVGKRLLQECIDCAQREGVPVLALHTSEIMQSARSLYRSAGFSFLRKLDPMFGIPYELQTKNILPTDD